MAYRPTVTGGTIAVADSDELATLDSNGLPPGSRVWNFDVGAYFALTVSTASLVPDQVVAVLGVSGLRWIVVPAGGGTVESVTATTSNAIDNSDPNNPVIKNAGAANAGVMAAADYSKLALMFARSSVNLTDADATVQCATNKIGQLVIPPATLTQNRVTTFGVTGASGTSINIVDVYRLGTEAFTETLKDDAGQTIFTIPASTKMMVTVFFNPGTGHYGLLSFQYLA